MYEPLRFMDQIEHMIKVPDSVHMEEEVNRRGMKYFDDLIEEDRPRSIFEFAIFWTQWLNNHMTFMDVAEFGITTDDVKEQYRLRRDEFQSIVEVMVPSAEDFYHHGLMNFLHHDWSRNKRVYKVDPAMSQDFLSMNMPKSVKTDTFAKLPSKCFYIDFDGADVHYCKGAAGIFIMYDVMNDVAVFYATTILPRERVTPITTVFRVGLSGDKELSTCLDMFRDRYKVPLEDGAVVMFRERELMRYLFNLFCYMGAVNNDIEHTERTKRIYRPRQEFSKPTNKMREVEEFGVGYRYSTSIPRRTSVNVINVKKDPDTPKRDYTSHYRSAHWHSYWVNDTDHPGAKKLVLKWLAETYVHGNIQSNKAVVHEVKGGRSNG